MTGDPYLGEIRMFAGGYAPDGWAICDGQELPVKGNERLAELLGVTSGTMFKLPDLRGRVPIAAGKGAGGDYAVGEQGGSETVTLTYDQLPSHSHRAQGSSQVATLKTPAGNVWAKVTGGAQYTAIVATKRLRDDSMTKTGGDKAHGNVMPCLAITFIIAVQGADPKTAR